MNAIHTNSSAPFFARNHHDLYNIDDFEILTTILSALTWRKHNGKIKLYTDNVGYNYYDSLEMLDLWDGGVDIEVIENIPASINQEIFWASSKLFALENESAPIVIIDTDLIVWDDITKLLKEQKIAVLHKEDLVECYLDKVLLKRRNGYEFNPNWDWNVLPCNTALAYFQDSKFLKYYTSSAIDFMTNNDEYPLEFVSQMVFAEQRLLSMCANEKNIPIYSFLSDPYTSENTCFTHLWGAKSMARSSVAHRKDLCTALLKQIRKKFPNYKMGAILSKKFSPFY